MQLNLTQGLVSKTHFQVHSFTQPPRVSLCTFRAHEWFIIINSILETLWVHPFLARITLNPYSTKAQLLIFLIGHVTSLKTHILISMALDVLRFSSAVFSNIPLADCDLKPFFLLGSCTQFYYLYTSNKIIHVD